MKKYHFVYKTTNLINNKFYIGKHSTNEIEDSYLGSGKWLNRAINKHGIENFKRNILKFFDTSEEAFAYEKILVTKKLIESENCYNISSGGDGGNIVGGRTFITNGKESKLIPDHESFLKNNPDWYLGCSTSGTKGKSWVTDGNEFRMVFEVEQFLLDNPEWKAESPHKGCVVVRNKDEIKILKRTELETYLLNNPDWIHGHGRNIMKDRFWVTNGTEQKLIKNVDKFLKNNLNWKLGNLPTVKDRKAVTNGKVTLLVDFPKDYIKEHPDFYLGTSQKTQKNWEFVTDGTSFKRVENVEKFLTENPKWYIGNNCSRNKNKKYVTNGIKNRMIPKHELSEFFKTHTDWRLGQTKRKN